MQRSAVVVCVLLALAHWGCAVAQEHSHSAAGEVDLTSDASSYTCDGTADSALELCTVDLSSLSKSSPPPSPPPLVPPFDVNSYAPDDALRAYAEWHTRTMADPQSCKKAEVLVWNAAAVRKETTENKRGVYRAGASAVLLARS